VLISTKARGNEVFGMYWTVSDLQIVQEGDSNKRRIWLYLFGFIQFEPFQYPSRYPPFRLVFRF